MSTRITLSNSRNVFLPFQHAGHLTLPEAATLTLKLLDILSEAPCDVDFLKLISRFLTKETYKELITERNISLKCGYPLCVLSQARVRDVYSEGNRVSKAMMPYSYLNSFCSKQHYQCSEFYATQLFDEALFAREDVAILEYGKMSKYEGSIVLLEEVLDSYKAKHNETSMLELVKNLDLLKIEQGNSKEDVMDKMSKMMGEIKIVEKETEAPLENDDTLNGMTDTEKYEYLQDQSKAIDGYVLR